MLYIHTLISYRIKLLMFTRITRQKCLDQGGIFSLLATKCIKPGDIVAITTKNDKININNVAFKTTKGTEVYTCWQGIYNYILAGTRHPFS